MRNGLAAGPLPDILQGVTLPFARIVNQACAIAPTFSPLVAYAVKMNETNLSDNPSELQVGADPTTMKMPDGSNAGRGPFQLTSSWPYDWRNPYSNALYAIHHDGFMLDAEAYWVRLGMQGDNLVRAIAASFNAGIGGAYSGHVAGDVDKNTTNRYGQRALAHYHALVSGKVS